jgi:hypothetical protein
VIAKFQALLFPFKEEKVPPVQNCKIEYDILVCNNIKIRYRPLLSIWQFWSFAEKGIDKILASNENKGKIWMMFVPGCSRGEANQEVTRGRGQGYRHRTALQAAIPV